MHNFKKMSTTMYGSPYQDPSASFNEKFAQDDQHNSFTLTSDGCMKRMEDKTPFRELELNNRVDHFGRGAMADERLLMNYVCLLKREGFQPNAVETIESFIIRHMDVISSLT
jgi:hypothetical protein